MQPSTTTQAAPLTGLVSPLARLEQTFAGKAFLALAATALVALCAHVSFRLPFTPVPLTLSNFAVVLVGLFLGPRLGFAALLAYLAEGAAGLPVFNPGGLGGIAQLFGPTGGYLLAYPIAAALAGSLARSLPHLARFASAAIAATAATLLVLACGTTWLAVFAHLSPSAAATLGLYPYLPGEVIKIIAAAGIYTTLSRPAQHA